MKQCITLPLQSTYNYLLLGCPFDIKQCGVCVCVLYMNIASFVFHHYK